MVINLLSLASLITGFCDAASVESQVLKDRGLDHRGPLTSLSSKLSSFKGALGQDKKVLDPLDLVNLAIIFEKSEGEMDYDLSDAVASFMASFSSAKKIQLGLHLIRLLNSQTPDHASASSTGTELGRSFLKHLEKNLFPVSRQDHHTQGSGRLSIG